VGERAESTEDGNQMTEYRRRTTAKKKESVRRGIGEWEKGPRVQTTEIR